MDATTFGGLSVAYYVAFRTLKAEEIEAIKQKGHDVLGRASMVMARVSFVDELRYSVPLHLTDLVQCLRRDDLETYLLCTCLDTLAGKDNYFDLQNWLKTKRNHAALGISEKHELLKEAESKKYIFSLALFESVLSSILEIYNNSYGVNRSIKQLVLSLPNSIKEELADAYIIYKDSQHNSEENWDRKTVDEKLKTIFIDYLFHYRRNLYTHEGRGFPGFGGIRSMREALRDGNIELPKPETHRLPLKNGNLVVTCKYGDEALFLREVIITCLAHGLGVLSSDWNASYRKAERQRRMLHALIYEIKHNIQVMQLHLQVLSEPLTTKASEGYPKLETEIAQTLLEQHGDVALPISNCLLQSYVQSALLFNDGIDAIGADTQAANTLMMKSGVRRRGMELGGRCIELLEEYPVWTYSTPVWAYFNSRRA